MGRRHRHAACLNCTWRRSMFRMLFRVILVTVVLVAAAAFFFGYRWAAPDDDPVLERPTPTTGIVDKIDRDRARETGARIGESVAIGAERAQRVVTEGSLTAKIKSKMALDDITEAADIDIDTTGSVVTLRGTVDSAAERTRA